jgi:26S proteasome regulatory subunit N2
LGLAYAGTSNNDAVRRLLHIAVSDTSDDVRRAAVTALAFVLFKNPGQVPRIVQLLSESYNPHVRCGATLALGIACAGTGLQVNDFCRFLLFHIAEVFYLLARMLWRFWNQ